MKGGGLILDSVLTDQAHTPGRPVNNMLVPGNTVKSMATAYRRTLQVIDTTAAGKTDNGTATGNSPNSLQGRTYQGGFVADQEHGYAIIRRNQSGRYYEGGMRQGQRHGYGSLVTPMGTMEGGFKHDKHGWLAGNQSPHATRLLWNIP